jgi:hypothetical protein
MGELQDVLQAMDDADIKTGMEFVRARQAAGGVVAPWELAVHIGTDGLRALCEAFDLEFDQIVAATGARGAVMSKATLNALGWEPCEQHAEVYAGLVASGLMTGLRMGLLIAHRRGER